MQAAALCFVNTVVQTAHGPNAKVFHQHEFLEAGFSIQEVERSLHGRQDERVIHELREWAKNYIDIQHYMDELAVARGRARDLKDEVYIAMFHSLIFITNLMCVFFCSWRQHKGDSKKPTWIERTNLSKLEG